MSFTANQHRETDWAQFIGQFTGKYKGDLTWLWSVIPDFRWNGKQNACGACLRASTLRIKKFTSHFCLQLAWGGPWPPREPESASPEFCGCCFLQWAVCISEELQVGTSGIWMYYPRPSPPSWGIPLWALPPPILQSFGDLNVGLEIKYK